MKSLHLRSLPLSFLLAATCSLGFSQQLLAAGPEKVDHSGPPFCSTEKVNHRDCIFTINRLYPVTFPTIQMSPGKKVIIRLENHLPFEVATLDETSATLLPGSDQVSSLVSSVMPNLKFVSTIFKPAQMVDKAVNNALQNSSTNAEEAHVQSELHDLQTNLDSAQQTIDGTFTDATVVFKQLSQVLSPLPRPAAASPTDPAPPPLVDPGTPDPFTNFQSWRSYLLCEIVGGNDCVIAPRPSFSNVLGEIASLQGRLPTATPAPPKPLFDQTAFDGLVTQVTSDIAALPAANRQQYNDALQTFKSQEGRIVSVMGSLAISLPNLQSALQTSYQNIQLAESITTPSDLGVIADPSSGPHPYPMFFGRQVTFSVNVANLVATSAASIITSAQKTSLETITVLYADPRFETSAGVLFNFVHNRTFANQTITTPVPGTSQIAGDIQIYETETRPAVVPFAAGHIRIRNDFIIPIDHRRGAFYGTAWIGINPNNSLPEYGVGPSFSWRSVMLSVLYDRTHDTRLAPGSYVGQLVCSPNPPAGGSLPSCSSAPPSPVTQTFGTNAVAFGISIRIPTSFATGTGGISR